MVKEKKETPGRFWKLTDPLTAVVMGSLMDKEKCTSVRPTLGKLPSLWLGR